MARNRTPNKPIGTCLCPFRDCDQEAPVFRYRAQTEDAKRQVRAGKLYMRCSTHGMTQDQEYILAHASITGEAPALDIEPTAEIQTESPPAPKTEAVKSPVPAEPEPGKARPSPKPAPKPAADTDGDAWGFFQ